jgi:hypothetical protein
MPTQANREAFKCSFGRCLLVLCIFGTLLKVASMEAGSVGGGKPTVGIRLRERDMNNRDCRNSMDLSYNGIQILLGITSEIDAEYASSKAGMNQTHAAKLVDSTSKGEESPTSEDEPQLG